jgi:alpha-D-ribose 1-methylphosphonate 5-triphosphate synthase subunit PhnH
MNALTPGFVDPVLDAQAAFRAVLEAMSRPGRVVVAGTALRPPAPLCPATAAVLLALADADTPLWSDAGADADVWLRFHCGTPIVASPGASGFALATAAPPALDALEAGTEEQPQRGATLVLQVAALDAGRGWRLTGPGIEHEHRLMVSGAPDGFLTAWAANRARFPRGVDVVLCAGDRIAALPRTVAIQEG